MKNVNWEPTKGSHFQARRGTDEDGNRYVMSANLEFVSVITSDGYTGGGWTAEEALDSAIMTRHDAMLEELIAEAAIKDVKIKAPPDLDYESLMFWRERAQEISDGFCEGQPVVVIRTDEWLTKNLPETNPQPSTRPGAEYGVDV